MRLRQLGTFNIASFLWLAVILSGMYLCRSAEPSHFEQANRLYEQGKFSEAAALYENMIKAGRQSSSVYFNLGNAYLKNGELGRAIFNYRMAASTSPRDPDIQANLRFAREKIPNSVSITPPVWQRLDQYFGINELALCSAALLWLWAGLVCLARLKPNIKSRLRSGTWMIGCLLLLCSSLLVLSAVQLRVPIAITTLPQTTVHLGPLTESQPAFTAPNGSELRILAQRGDWLQVTDQSGRSGWLARSNVLTYPKP